jgi:hypothetical protein
VNDIADTRAILSALADADGVPPLLDLLTRVEQDLDTVRVAIHAAGAATDNLETFHTTLFRLRKTLEPIRDAMHVYDDEADALYWSQVASHAAVQPVQALIRAQHRWLDDLVFGLPARPPSPIVRPRRPIPRPP